MKDMPAFQMLVDKDDTVLTLDCQWQSSANYFEFFGSFSEK